MSERNHKQLNDLVSLNANNALNERTKEKIESVLAQQAEFLLERKEKEIMKKKKLQELQEKFQVERSLKIQRFNNKISKSETVRGNNHKSFTEKTKKKQEYYQSVLKKIANERESALEKQLEVRKEYQPSDNDNKSVNHSQTSRVRGDKNHSFLYSDTEKGHTDAEMRKISERIDRAKTNHDLQQQIRIAKAKSQSKQVDQKHQKAKVHSNMAESQTLKMYYNRAQEESKAFNRHKQKSDKQHEERKKSMEEKMKKCHENLKHLEDERQEKLEQKLKQKMDRQAKPKTWRNERADVYKQRFIQNAKKLQQVKNQKGDDIISKHAELTNKNRTLKDKKDKLYKAIMIE